MADKFKLNIISPEKKFLEGDCEFLEFVSTWYLCKAYSADDDS